MNRTGKIFKYIFIFAISQFISIVGINASACTVAFWNNNGVTNIVARSMDLFMDDQPYLVVYPKNTPHSGKAGENSLNWISKYGTIVVAAQKAGKEAVSEGMNEQGLAASLLYLDKSTYEKRNPKIPGISNLLWVQYVLDNFNSVQDVIDNLNKFQVVSVTALGKEWPFHLAMQDQSGDFAVFEYINGKLVVHHGKQYRVATNEPAYEEQLANVKRYKLFGGKLSLPGDPDPLSRFVRASTFLKTLPQPKDDIQAAAYLLGVIKTVELPMGAEDTSGNETEDAWPTRWITIKNLNKKMFYFSSTNAPHFVWLDFAKLKLNAGDPIVGLDPTDPTLSGDMTQHLSPYTPPSL